jgi:hypothetical protein
MCTIAPILGLAVAVGAPSTLAAQGSDQFAHVIVMAAPGETASIERAVERVGGVVDGAVDHRRVLGGCSRRRPPVPSRPPGVVSVSADSEMQPQDATYDQRPTSTR